MGILRFGNRRKTAASDNPASSGVCILPKKLRWRRRNGNMPHPPRFLPSRHRAHGYIPPLSRGGRCPALDDPPLRPTPPASPARGPARPPPSPLIFRRPRPSPRPPPSRAIVDRRRIPPPFRRGRIRVARPDPPPGPLLREIDSSFALAAAGGAPHRVPRICCFHSSLHPASVRRLSADHDDVISSMILSNHAAL